MDGVVERKPLDGPRPGRDEPAARGRVIHEESPDDIVSIPEARFGIVVREEQQPCVLDASEGEDEEPRLDPERTSGCRGGEDATRAPGGALRFDPQHPRVDDQGDVVRSPRRFGQVAGEDRPGPVADDPRDDPLAELQRSGARRDLPLRRVVGQRGDPADPGGAVVVRIELCPVERPAAERDVRSLLEVDRLETTEAGSPARSGDLARPEHRRPSDALGAHRLERRVGAAGHLAVEDVVGCLARSGASFEHADPSSRRAELGGERQPDGSRAHDAEVRFEDLTLREAPRVDEHQRSPVGKCSSDELNRSGRGERRGERESPGKSHETVDHRRGPRCVGRNSRAAEHGSGRSGNSPDGVPGLGRLQRHRSATAVRFASDGRVFVAQKNGLLKEFDSLTDTTPTTVLDLRDEVHNYWDRGLLGLALDPNFPATPYIYVLVVVRRARRADGAEVERRVPDAARAERPTAARSAGGCAAARCRATP